MNVSGASEERSIDGGDDKGGCGSLVNLPAGASPLYKSNYLSDQFF